MSDVVIMGGGLAGLSLGVQLKQRCPDISITIVERNPYPLPKAAHKVGESLVELSTYYFTQVLGLTDHMKKDQLPKLGLRFFFEPGQSPEKKLEDCVELGPREFPTSPSYQLDRGIFENFLIEKCREMGITVMDGTRVVKFRLKQDNDLHEVTARHASGDEILQCRFLVDATSRISLIKNKLDLATPCEHKVSAAWFRVKGQVNISDWSGCEEWRQQNSGDKSRWFSTNHLMGEGYWVWVIPLSSGATSVGIVADNAIHPLDTYNSLSKAMEWLSKFEPICERALRGTEDDVLDFKFLKNFAHNCSQVYSRDDWFLTGEAGSFLDPFYSPGSDLIAISNTFVTNLIELRLAGADTAKETLIFNNFYLNIVKNTALIYQDMYPVFGNPVVMPTKILWDFAVYWSFTAFLFIQGRFDSYEKLFSFRKKFEELGDINMRMQAFFRDWHGAGEQKAEQHYIDPFEVPLLKELNQTLYPRVKDEEFEATFDHRVARLKQLGAEIVHLARSDYPSIGEGLKEVLDLEPAGDIPDTIKAGVVKIA